MTIPQLPGVTVRRAMQTLGTEWGRGLDPQIWVRIAMEKALGYTVNGLHCIITDVRFQNELDAILARGGVVYRVDRGPGATDLSHASEREQVDAAFTEQCVTVRNDGTLERLRAAAVAIASKIANNQHGGGYDESQ